MVDERSTIEASLEGRSASTSGIDANREVLALVLAWSRKEPDRIGEVVLVDAEQILGRGSARPDDAAPRAELVRQRPGVNLATPPIGSPRVSRAQLALRPSGDRIAVESLGLCPMLLNGTPARAGEIGPGDTLHIEHEMLFIVARRPACMPPLRTRRYDDAFAFGEVDPYGYVGESPAAWRLRDEIAFAAGAAGHVLVTGESGVGKELVAEAVHRLSPRGKSPLVARNAATFPEGLLDAELFGNVKNYPNPGTPEREGLIGEADGTSLFLDEIGELPERLQAHLLRVLDRRGEYHRLGESRARRADVRFIAATNRRIDELKHDLAARFTLRLAVPTLPARREDVPLLIRHVLRRIAQGNEHVARTFFEPVAADGPQAAPNPGPGEPASARLAPDLVERLLVHAYRLHARELEQILWQSLTESRGDHLELTQGVAQRLAEPAARPAIAAPSPPPKKQPARKKQPPPPARDIDRRTIEDTLARTHGNVTRAARELGLPSRYALYRLMRKLGIGSAEADQAASAEHGPPASDDLAPRVNGNTKR
ncbi:Nitrogen regulation protein NtrC [Minicystis rosea]|nr:Nitrogen regulation protein NtrC [Minicystis rosea]